MELRLWRAVAFFAALPELLEEPSAPSLARMLPRSLPPGLVVLSIRERELDARLAARFTLARADAAATDRWLASEPGASPRSLAANSGRPTSAQFVFSAEVCGAGAPLRATSSRLDAALQMARRIATALTVGCFLPPVFVVAPADLADFGSEVWDLSVAPAVDAVADAFSASFRRISTAAPPVGSFCRGTCSGSISLPLLQ
mmetsp:Transcript_25461/g.64270  ORF Transcript_25461/g.64270 Transcript_25461/m.64270 type:complete len:201 (-) Transcript_25461:382-984(-)